VARDQAVVAGKTAGEATEAQVRCAARWSFWAYVGQGAAAAHASGVRAPEVAGIVQGPAAARARKRSHTTHTNAGTKNLLARRMCFSADPAPTGARTLPHAIEGINSKMCHKHPAAPMPVCTHLLCPERFRCSCRSACVADCGHHLTSVECAHVCWQPIVKPP